MAWRSPVGEDTQGQMPIGYDSRLYRMRLRSVEHFPQRETWDCGVACCVMVSRLLGLPYSYSDWKLQCLTHCIWTVDMLLALHRCGIAATMHTTCPGVNPQHATQGFYADESFDSESQRVRAAFLEASSLRLPISTTDVSIGHLSSWQNCVAIVLVDRNVLRCEDCWTPGANTSAASFVGHYIIVVGKRKDDASAVEFVDPASQRSRCWASVGNLEQARSSPGTDRDVIIVRTDQVVETNSYYRIQE
ncbi:Guanylyl cyclase [Plasmodiophora brassicae]